MKTRIALAEEEQMVDEVSETVHGRRPSIPMPEPDAQAYGRFPEMTPAPGEQACPHGMTSSAGRNERT